MLMLDTITNGTVVGFADIKSEPDAIQGWEEYLSDGDAFLRTALAAHAKKRKAFTPVILYNIVAMAIEKHVMAALMKKGELPYNHTMGDLVAAMEEVFPEAISEIKDGLLDLDRYQEICDVDTFTITPPVGEEISVMLVLAVKMQELAHIETGGTCS
jgi:hypothetical protein